MFFNRQRSDQSVGDVLNYLSNLASPNFFWSEDARNEVRNNRTIPILLSSWEKKQLEFDPVQAVTKDISSTGLCAVSPKKWELGQKLLIGTFIKSDDICEVCALLGHIAWIEPSTQELWQIGIKIDEVLDLKHDRHIKNFFESAEKQLRPPSLTSGS